LLLRAGPRGVLEVPRGAETVFAPNFGRAIVHGDVVPSHFRTLGVDLEADSLVVSGQRYQIRADSDGQIGDSGPVGK